MLLFTICIVCMACASCINVGKYTDDAYKYIDDAAGTAASGCKAAIKIAPIAMKVTIGLMDVSMSARIAVAKDL